MPWRNLWRRPAKWADLALRTKCLLLISFPAAATVFMFGVASVLAARNSAAMAEAVQAFQTAQEIERLHAAETETSASVRGYFISGQERFARLARRSLANFDLARQQLSNLTLNDNAQQQRLAQIASFEHSREERMFGAMARFSSNALPWDQLRAELEGAQTDVSGIEDLLRAMQLDNAGQIETASRRMRSSRSQQGAITGLCLFLGLLGGAATTLLFARGITRRIDRVQRNLARLPGGAIPEPIAGRDEIGALNEGLIQVAEALRRKDLALENALEGIAEVNSDGCYLWMNPAYGSMTGSSQLQRPANLMATVDPGDQAKVQGVIAQMRSAGRAEVEARINHSSSHSGGHSSDHSSDPVCDAGITFLAAARDPDSSFYVFLRDIGAGKRSDAALLQAKNAALASNRAKTEFLAKISHDIRTPLNAILGSADLLSETPLNADQSGYVSMFQRNCRRLVALINDFLDFSRIEAGAVRLDREPFRIREIVDDAVATFREPAHRKGIALGVEIDPATPGWALGDALRIHQVLVNLLSNALKFTAHGRVDVHVQVSSEGPGSELRFEVRDTGPGIRLEDQARIFARFVQLPDQSNGQRGSGLGLAICHDLVELMGGQIGVASREGGGSAFHFSLPLEAVEPVLAGTNSKQTALAAAPSGEPIRILAAEDSEDNRLLLEHYLRNEPVKLRMAQNGQEALDAIQQGEQFDLILMDIDMPLMDGYTATRRILDCQQARVSASSVTGQNETTPIVALSADAMREAVRASLDAGCVAHVAKPVDRETLLKTIRRFARIPAAPGVGAGPAVSAAPAVSTEPPVAPSATIVPIRPAVAVSEQIKALVPNYLATKETQIQEARGFLAARDFDPIRSFGHNLKGTGRSYGFPPMEEMGREIERAAAQADTGRIAEQLDALDRFVSESAAALASA